MIPPQTDTSPVPTQAPDSIGFLTVDLARLFRHAFERSVAAEGLDLTAGEARTLLHLSCSPGIRQSALAESMRVEPMTLSGFLDRLEGRGLVRRCPDPSDRRAKQVMLSEAARPLVNRIQAVADTVRVRATHGLSSGEVEALRRTLKAMRLNLSEAGEGAAA